MLPSVLTLNLQSLLDDAHNAGFTPECSFVNPSGCGDPELLVHSDQFLLLVKQVNSLRDENPFNGLAQGVSDQAEQFADTFLNGSNEITCSYSDTCSTNRLKKRILTPSARSNLRPFNCKLFGVVVVLVGAALGASGLIYYGSNTSAKRAQVVAEYNKGCNWDCLTNPTDTTTDGSYTCTNTNTAESPLTFGKCRGLENKGYKLKLRYIFAIIGSSIMSAILSLASLTLVLGYCVKN